MKPFKAKAKAFQTFLPANAWSRQPPATPRNKQPVTPRATAKQEKEEEEDQLNQLTTISLDDFFKDEGISSSSADTITKSSRLSLRVNEREVETCFKEALKLIYSPISSQLPHDYTPNTSEEFFCGRLVDTVRAAFPDCMLSFEQRWREIHLESFPPVVNPVTKEPLMIIPIDHALRHLHLRKYALQNQNKRENDFDNEKQYRSYKELETRDIDSLIKRARTYRSKNFTLKLDLNVNSLKLDVIKKSDVYYKIRLSEQENTVVQMVKAAKIETVGNQSLVSFKPDKISITCHTRYQDLLIHVYKKNVRTTRVGEVRIPFKSLIRMFQPPDCSWGVQTFDSEFDIMECTSANSTTSKKIGTMHLGMLMQMEAFPPLFDYSEKHLNAEKTPNYRRLFDLLLQRLVSLNEGKPIQDKKDKKVKRPDLLTYQQSWIIEEYCHQHGISEIYKRLALMREMVQKTDLLLLFIDDFKQSFDYVVTSIRAKHVIATRQDVALLNDIKDELVHKIEFVLCRFITVLEGGRRKVLEVLIELLEFIRTRDKIEDEIMNKDEFKARLRKLFQLAIEEDYDVMRQEQIDSVLDDNSSEITAASLIKITQLLKQKVDDVLFYSSAMPDYINYQAFAMHVYYDKFDTDYEVVAKQGFTGYEMLVFCKKLRELHEEIECSFDEDELKQEKMKLLDINMISKGYEEKYVLELKTRLMTHMQRAIALDRWKKVNDEALYSDSLIDFFTSANQTVSFVNDLEFLSKSLLDRFAVVIGECVVEYAKALHTQCIKEIVAQESQDQSKDAPKTTSLLKFGGFKSKLPSAKASETVNITPEFIVKFNDIEASRQQFKELIQQLKDGNIYIDQETDDDEDDESDEDLDSDDSESDESETSENSKKKKQDGVDKVIASNLQKTLFQLDTVTDDLVSLIISQFDPFIRNSVLVVMQFVKKNVKRPLDANYTPEHLIKEHGPPVTRLFNQIFFEEILSPNLEVISDNIYDLAFQKILARTFADILRYCVELLVPAASFGSDVSEPLDAAQVVLLKHLIKFAGDYFYGNGEGISKDIITRERKFIDRIFKLMEMDTQKLTEVYTRFANANTAQSSVRGYHILAVISGRVKYDKLAASFLMQNQQQALQLYLAQEFSLERDINLEKASIVLTNKAQNEKLKKGTFFLLPNYLLWSPTAAIRRRLDVEFTKSSTSVDLFSGKFKIHVKDIQQMRPMNPFIGKGIKFYLTKELPPMKLYLDNRSTRDTLLSTIASEGKKLGHNIEILEARKRSLAESIVPFGKKKPGPQRVLTMPEQVFSTINPAMVSSKDIAKVLQTRFGISGANLIERYSASCSIDSSEESTGTLYLFDTCFCFDSLGNYSIDDTDLLSSWYRVDRIETNDADQFVEIRLQDGRNVRFYGFLSDFPEVAACLTKLKQDYDKDNRQLNMKATDPKVYFLARFNLKHDNLKMTCACSIPGKALFTETGMLFIGEKHLCYERDNNASNPIIIPMSQVKSVIIKSWRLNGKICLRVTFGQKQEQKFIIKNGIQQVMEEIQRRIQ